MTPPKGRGRQATPAKVSPDAQKELEARIRTDKAKAYYDAISPQHVNGSQYTAMVTGMLHRNPDLLLAAIANPISLMAAMADCAMQGLIPGHGYAFIPFKNEQTGVPDIVGVIEVEGIIEQIFRTGRVEAVIARAVREKDDFERGEAETDPPHWQPLDDGFAPAEVRGRVRGVFAYAKLVGGGNSQVVYLGPQQFHRSWTAARAKTIWGREDPMQVCAGLQEGAGTKPEAPDFEAQCIKTGVRRLRRWVPKSAEFVTRLMEAQAKMAAVEPPEGLTPGAIDAAAIDFEAPDTSPLAIAGTAEPAGGRQREPNGGAGDSRLVPAGLATVIGKRLEQAGLPEGDDRAAVLSGLTGRPVARPEDLTREEGDQVRDAVQEALDGAGGDQAQARANLAAKAGKEPAGTPAG